MDDKFLSLDEHQNRLRQLKKEPMDEEENSGVKKGDETGELIDSPGVYSAVQKNRRLNWRDVLRPEIVVSVIISHPLNTSIKARASDKGVKDAEAHGIEGLAEKEPPNVLLINFAGCYFIWSRQRKIWCPIYVSIILLLFIFFQRIYPQF